MNWIGRPDSFHTDHAVRATWWRHFSIEIGFDRCDAAAYWAFEFIDRHLAPETFGFLRLHTTCIQRSVRKTANCR